MKKIATKATENLCIGNHSNDTHYVHTLGQLRTLPATGTGVNVCKSDIDLQRENLKKRARAKYYSMPIIESLIRLESPLNTYYERALSCCESLSENNGKITGKYCDTRVCNICNRIRTAKFMNGYISQLEKLGDLYFVTLTIKNCKGYQLRETIESMCKTVRKINDCLRKYKPTSGLRKIEVTYNPVTNEYHPHFHILIENKDSAEYLYKKWLELNPKLTKKKGQDIKKANKESYNELFKYTTKILHKGELIDSKELIIYPEAIDIITRAMYKKRAFQTFGSLKKVSEEIEKNDLQAQMYESNNIDSFQWCGVDWVNDSGELLTNYTPTKNIKIVSKQTT